MRHGVPKCVCNPPCSRKLRNQGPVCGSDGVTYRHVCRMRRIVCRTSPNYEVKNYSASHTTLYDFAGFHDAIGIAYFGICKSMDRQLVEAVAAWSSPLNRLFICFMSFFLYQIRELRRSGVSREQEMRRRPNFDPALRRVWEYAMLPQLRTRKRLRRRRHDLSVGLSSPALIMRSWRLRTHCLPRPMHMSVPVIIFFFCCCYKPISLSSYGRDRRPSRRLPSPAAPYL